MGGGGTTYQLLSRDAKEKRLEYLREWRKNNPEKCRLYQARYWNRRAEQEKRSAETERGENNG